MLQTLGDRCAVTSDRGFDALLVAKFSDHSHKHSGGNKSKAAKVMLMDQYDNIPCPIIRVFRNTRLSKNHPPELVVGEYSNGCVELVGSSLL